MYIERYEEIIRLNLKGYNCAQSVSCTYADLTDLKHEDLYKLTEGLGGGMGQMRETCGALTATFLIISYLNSDATSPGKTKHDTYAKIRILHDAFVKKLGSSNCKILLNGEKPKTGTCNDKLKVACEILEEMI